MISSESEPFVSIVVCAHNELNNLQKLIPLLLDQNYKKFEIILVDDRSEDKTSEYLSKIKDKRLSVLRIDQTPANYNPKKFALEQGISKASGEIILLTDGDCFPKSNNWILAMQRNFQKGKKLVLGYSPYIKKPGLLNLFIRFETFFTAIQYFSLALRGLPYMGVGRNMAYTKELFQQKNAFHGIAHVTGGDDDLFVQKAATAENTTIELSSESQVFSLPKNSYPAYFRQKLRHLSAGLKYNLKSRFILGLLVVSQALFYFSLITLCIYGITTYLLLIAFVFRTLLLIIIFAAIEKNLDEDFKWWLLPILDFLYIINYITIAISTTVANKSKWN
ncbi:MAG TPA: glycosyltransferase [Cytophagaceae bacterium]